jgi:2-polyprenyl-3-methyl-5-hydroxy-6-metoxy-1,4-benzoquinol methylase
MTQTFHSMSQTSKTGSQEHCPSCDGGAVFSFSAPAHDGLAGETVSIHECSACGFAWQAKPKRSAIESVKHFETSYRPVASNPSGYFDSEYKSQVAALQLSYLQSLRTAGPKLLDVGGGSGAFATAAAMAGWDACAVDPALDAALLAGAGVRAYRGFVSALPSEEAFHVATLWDVIEHVEEPLAFLRDLKSRLLPDAVVVISTGNYKSADRVSAGTTHWIYQLDHRWYFSPESLARLLQAAGLEVFSLYDRVLRPDWGGQEQYPGPQLRALLSSIVKRPLTAMDALRRYQALRGARSWPQSGLAIFTVAARLASTD